MRRIVCLLTVIFGMVSCSEESLPEIKEGQSSDEVIHQQLTFKELSLKMSENPMVFTYEFKSVVIENYELSVSYVLKNLSETESTTEPVIDYFFDPVQDRKSTRLNSSHVKISYAVFCLKKKTLTERLPRSDLHDSGYRRTHR